MLQPIDSAYRGLIAVSNLVSTFTIKQSMYVRVIAVISYNGGHNIMILDVQNIISFLFIIIFSSL